MQNYEVCFDGWDGDPYIEELARAGTQLLIDRGAKIVQVTLAIVLGYNYRGKFLVEYDPSQTVKIYNVDFKYDGDDICYHERGVTVWWKNSIRAGVDEGLVRMDTIDKQKIFNAQGSYGKF